MNKKSLFLLILIFLLGFLVRIWQIDKIPPGLNRDEASIGYTAYSLIKTGNDEYGISWPLSFKSFGDWKLPLYIYISVPFVYLLGLTDTTVRLPAVLFSSLTVFVCYFLAKELFKNTRKLPLLAAFLFALSPWSIHLSRNASESTVTVFLTSLGILLFLKSANNKFYNLLAPFFLALPLYTYHGNHIFSTLLFIGLTVFFWKRNKSSAGYWVSIAIFAVMSFFIFSRTLFVADKTKISGLFAIGDPSVVFEEITSDRNQHTITPLIFGTFLHNKLTFTAISVFQNYIKSFSPEFLFITGGGNTQHNIPDFGNLYLWEAPFLLLGLAFLLVLKSDYKYLILFWLFISPIAASITKDAPHTNRMTGILPLINIIVAFGFIKAFESLKFRKIVFSVLVILFMLNFTLWTDRYFIHFPFKRAGIWGEGYTTLVSYLSANNNFAAKKIVMSRPEYSPYIYFLFYNKTDPLQYQNSVIRYPETDEGFQHVAGFDNLNFRQIDWSLDLALPDSLYIDWTDQVPKSATNSSTLITNEVMNKLIESKKDVSDLKIGDLVVSQKITDIKLQNKESMFTLIKTSKLQ